MKGTHWPSIIDHWLLTIIFLISLLPGAVSAAQIRLSGSVMDLSDETPIPGVRVDLRTKEGFEPLDPAITYTDANGLYSLEDIPAGDWRVRAVYGNATVMERIIMTPVISVGEGNLEFHFRINQETEDYDEQVRSVRMRPLNGVGSASHITITGFVEELRGKKAIAGASISILEKADTTDEGTIYKAAARALSDSSGAFEITLLPKGVYLLDVHHPDYESTARTQLSLTRPVELIISMWEGSKRPKVAGLVLDEETREIDNVIRTTQRIYAGTLIGRLIHAGAPAGGAKIYLLDQENRPVRGIDVGIADATGVYRVEHIDPGAYKIRVEYAEDVYEVEGVTVILGQNELNISY